MKIQSVIKLVVKYLTLILEGKSCVNCDVFSSYYNDVYYNQGFQTGSIQQILSRLDEAEIDDVYKSYILIDIETESLAE